VTLKAEDIPNLLRESVQGFEDSLEWQILAQSQSHEDAAIVVGAFANFLVRIEETSRDAESLATAYEVIERLATGGHAALVEDEVFREIDTTRPATRSGFEAALLPASAELFASWRRHNPHRS
jgi:hypothetical protein